MEWGRWPIFLSQPIAPILLLFLDWKTAVVTANVFWALFFRYQFVNVPLAYLGALFVKLKWLTILPIAVYLFAKGEMLAAMFSLFWPVLIFIIGAIPTTQVGRIQSMFMAKLGYEHVPAELRAMKSELAGLTFNSDVSERLIKKARRRYPQKTEVQIYRDVIEQYKKDHDKR